LLLLAGGVRASSAARAEKAGNENWQCVMTQHDRQFGQPSRRTATIRPRKWHPPVHYVAANWRKREENYT
jgi:hypothetical protein